MSLTEAVEEEAARQVHATHERIMTETDPDPARRRPSGIAFRDTSSVSKKMYLDPSQKLKDVQTLTLEEQLVADMMQALKASRKSTRIQPHAGGSSKGTCTKPGVSDESTVILKTSSEELVLNQGFLMRKRYFCCNTPKLGRSGIWVRGVLLLRSITQDIYRTTKKSFENDTLDLTK
ncbi:hypothetical protein Tco_0658631 [Tanacetum coccineum]